MAIAVRRILPATIALALLAGCQVAPPLHALKQPLFAVGQAPTAGSAVVAPTSVGYLGVLTVSFQGELARLAAQRRILATVADVDKVVVTVKPDGGAEVSQTVLKAAITSGQTSVTFQGLPPGAATVTIAAFDASGADIGTVSRTATVVAGTTTAVDIALQLNPTYSAGTGGGSSPTTGGLTANVTLQDGIQALGPFEVGARPAALEFDQNGNVWILAETGQAVVKLSPDGSKLGTYTIMDNPNALQYFLTVAPDGRIYTAKGDSGGGGYVFEPDGTLVENSFFSFNAGGNVVFDALGNGYFAQDMMNRIGKLAPDGSVATGFEIPFEGASVALTPDGHLWVVSDPLFAMQHEIVKVSTSGVVVGTFTLPAAGYEVKADGLGNVWVRTGDGIVKFASDGQQVATVQQKGRIQVDSLNRLWVRERDRIACYGEDGVFAAAYTVPSDTHFDIENAMGLGVLNFDAAGNIWVVNAGAGNVIKFQP